MLLKCSFGETKKTKFQPLCGKALSTASFPHPGIIIKTGPLEVDSVCGVEQAQLQLVT
jgi:hypothetical protein